MRKKISIFVLIFSISVALGIFFTYELLFADNIKDHNTRKEHVLFIHTGSNYNDVIRALKKQKLIKNMETFKIVSKRLKYDQHIMPGRYVISNNTGNLFLIRKLYSGSQTPVKITFNNIQDKAIIEKNQKEKEQNVENVENQDEMQKKIMDLA